MQNNICGQRIPEERIAWLNQAQKYPLKLKIELSKARIREWYEYYNGRVYVAYSGGWDSSVLLHLVRTIYPEIEGVFCDTGQEFHSILRQVARTKKVITLHPSTSFEKVLKEHGYPIISKRVCRYVNDLRVTTGNNEKTKKLRLTGINSSGKLCPSMKLSKKWLKLVDAPFGLTSKCCSQLKINPTKPYQKETGKKPFVGTMADESTNRRASYAYGGGCNAFDQKDVQSRPLMFWTEQDVLQYAKLFNVRQASVYGDLVEGPNGYLIKTGEQRTGCKYCLFGVHLDKNELGENRLQRLARLEPESYKYAIEELGYKVVMEYIGEEWRPFNPEWAESLGELF